MTPINIVSFEDWQKLDFRVGKIIEVEDIEGADKLYKLKIDIGETENRTVCAGLKEYYSKEELTGKKIILFVNLASRKLRGIESQGMVLAAVDKNKNKVILISPENNIDVGCRVS
jgi:methionyl-tRNA synthetase